MRIATATLKSLAPYSQSRSYSWEIPTLNREGHDQYEERTWRHKCHSMPDGKIFIPPMAFKMALDNAAGMLGIKIPGRGKATYSKFFISGVLILDPVILPLTKEQVGMDRIYANSDGKRGSGKRVWRNFPRIDAWEVDVPFQILADEIREDIFEQTLRQAGQFIGIGRFRPQNGGFYGRFTVQGVEWRSMDLKQAA
jgi:hypothetical protein